VPVSDPIFKSTGVRVEIEGASRLSRSTGRRSETPSVSQPSASSNPPSTSSPGRTSRCSWSEEPETVSSYREET